MFMYQDAYLPGLQKYCLKVRQHFDRIKSFSLEEGLYIINHVKQKHLHGVEVEGITDPQSTRIRMIANGQTTCVECGVKGNHFYIERHKNDKVSKFSLNLYAIREDGSEVMLTWDHILPKSLGGSNLLRNAQCMCQPCNAKKGHHLSWAEMIALGSREDALDMYKIPTWDKSVNIDKTLKMVRHDNAQMVKIPAKAT